MMKFSFLRESEKERYERELQSLKDQMEKIEGEKAKRDFLISYAIGGKNNVEI